MKNLRVTGGIAAYKSAYLTRGLVKAGARVIVLMTRAARRFVRDWQEPPDKRRHADD